MENQANSFSSFSRISLLSLSTQCQGLKQPIARPVVKGNVFLLPASIGACTFRPRSAVSVLEIEIPE